MTRHLVIYEPTAPPPAWFFPALAAAVAPDGDVDPVSVSGDDSGPVETLPDHLAASVVAGNVASIHAFPGRPHLLAYRIFRQTGIPWVAHQTTQSAGPLKIQPIAATAVKIVAHGTGSAEAMAQWGIQAGATWDPGNPPHATELARLAGTGRAQVPAAARTVSCLVLTEIDPFIGLNQRFHHLVAYLSQVFDRVTVICYNARIPLEEPHLAALAKDPTNPLDIHHTTVHHGNVTYFGIPALPPTKALERFGLDLRGWYRTLLSLIDRYARTLLSGDRFDLCFAHGPKPGRVAAGLKQLGVAGFTVYEDLDNFGGFYVDHPGLHDEVLQYENAALKENDLVVSISQGLAAYHARLAPIRNHLVIPNGVDYELFSTAQAHPRTEPVLIYTGSIEEWAGLDIAVEAVDILRSRIPNVRLLVLGGGTGVTDLLETIRRRGLENAVLYLGQVPYNRLPLYLRQARVGLVPFRSTELTECAFPLKVVEYISAGLAVLGSDCGETARLIREHQVGLVAGTPDEMALHAYSLLTDETLYRRLSGNSVREARKYDWSSLFNREMEAVATGLGLGNDIGMIWSRHDFVGTEQKTGTFRATPNQREVPEKTAPVMRSESFTFLLTANGDPKKVVDQTLAFVRAFTTDDPVSLIVTVNNGEAAASLHRLLDEILRQRGYDPEKVADIEVRVAPDPVTVVSACQVFLCLDPRYQVPILQEALERGLSVAFDVSPPEKLRFLAGRKVASADTSDQVSNIL